METRPAMFAATSHFCILIKKQCVYYSVCILIYASFMLRGALKEAYYNYYKNIYL